LLRFSVGQELHVCNIRGPQSRRFREQLCPAGHALSGQTRVICFTGKTAVRTDAAHPGGSKGGQDEGPSPLPSCGQLPR
jgi:hypothetical protein